MRKLAWDSNHWGVNVYHLEKTDLIKYNINDEEPYFIQALPNISELEFIHSLEKKGFNFQETKITFFKKKKREVDIDTSNFITLSKHDISAYENHLYELYGQNTRYRMFPSEKVNDFYYSWLINSIDGQMDDECIGYFVGGRLAGFVTYKFIDDFINIGLLGVFPLYRGSGVSQHLLKYVDKIAKDNISVKSIKISTQGQNKSAINAYIKNGFLIDAINQWYYFIKGDIK